MIFRVFTFILLIIGLLNPRMAHAETKHSTLTVNGVPVQLPFAPRDAGQGDITVDVYSLQGVLPISVESRGAERIIRYGGHQLEVRPGRVAAMLDGRWLILKHAPVEKMGGLLLPNRQLFDLLTVPYRMEDGGITVTLPSDSVEKLWKEAVKLEGNKSKIGFIGVLRPSRWIVAMKTLVDGKEYGYGNLYEASRETNANGVPEWKLTKLRTVSDTAGQVYLEWMPNGSVFENIVSDKRPEFLIVETCDCVGRYQYGTMFTVTEIGLVPVWHSQATYDRVQKTAKGWVLVTHRKDAIPTRTSATMPFWEIHEMWNGQSFVIIKQEYRDPLK